MKELKLVGWRLGGIECVGPPRVGVIWEEMGTAANGRETTRQGIWAGAAPPPLLKSLVILTIVSY